MNRWITVNGAEYRCPSKAVVVVCIDGGDPAYFTPKTLMRMPNLSNFMKQGFYKKAKGVIPSFTNPNNISIISGKPPSFHGISGNYFLDPQTKKEVMMTDPKYITCETILEKYSQSGGKVVSITAKDKLRKLLGKGIDITSGSINFSSEKADQTTLIENGIENVLQLVGKPVPDVYSADLSLFVMEAGIKILEKKQHEPVLMYLSLTDYIQHKHAPDDPTAVSFYSKLDESFGKLQQLGALVAITADHGMNDKSDLMGNPNVIYLQDLLDHQYGKDTTKVICPITDPYVAHHGSLGGFVRVYSKTIEALSLIKYIKGIPGVEAVFSKHEAAEEFGLPVDREADVVVIGDVKTVLGNAKASHDLSALNGERLRSHGAIADADVPLILSEPLSPTYLSKIQSQSKPLRNFDIFELALNGVQT